MGAPNVRWPIRRTPLPPTLGALFVAAGLAGAQHPPLGTGRQSWPEATGIQNVLQAAEPVGGRLNGLPVVMESEEVDGGLEAQVDAFRNRAYQNAARAMIDLDAALRREGALIPMQEDPGEWSDARWNVALRLAGYREEVGDGWALLATSSDSEGFLGSTAGLPIAEGDAALRAARAQDAARGLRRARPGRPIVEILLARDASSKGLVQRTRILPGPQGAGALMKPARELPPAQAWRRVVPSSEPILVWELDAVRGKVGLVMAFGPASGEARLSWPTIAAGLTRKGFPDSTTVTFGSDDSTAVRQCTHEAGATVTIIPPSREGLPWLATAYGPEAWMRDHFGTGNVPP